MTENIELKSYSRSYVHDNDIEEYHEIDEEAFHERNVLLQHDSGIQTRNIPEDDFFIQYDVKSNLKKPGKRKQSKKKAKISNLMDIITSELATLSLPVTEKLVITSSDYSKAQQSMFLKNSGLRNFFKKPFGFIPEDGYGDQLLTAVLRPTYPKILDNEVVEYQPIPVQYMEAATFVAVVASNEADEGISKFLDLVIKDIRFKYHHEFCLEELLCVKLVECYNEYKENEKLRDELRKEIKINRETRDSLKEDIMSISAKKENVRFDETIRKYTAKIFQLKYKYLEAINLEKDILHRISSVWSDIIMVREKSKYTKTNYVLDIKKTENNSDDFDKVWAESFNMEYADKLDELEYDFVTKYKEHKTAKINKSNVKIAKPKLEINEEELKSAAESVANKTVAKDAISITLRQDPNIVSSVRKSKTPRSKSFYFKIYVDDVFVCESEIYENNIKDKCNVELTESFSVQILPENTTIAIELYEQDEPVSYLKMNLKNIKNTDSSGGYKTEVFMYNNIVEPNSKYVGSGHNIKEIAAANKVRLKSSNLFRGNLYTTCETDIQMSWNETLSENKTESIKSSMEIGRKLKRLLHGIEKPSVDLLRDIIEKLYEKDIQNDEEMINTLRSLCKMNISTDDEIPIDEKNPEYVRLKLLHLRNNGGFTNVEHKAVPLRASQISTEQLNCLQKSTENEIEVQYYEKQDMDPIEIQRYIGVKYVEKLNKNMLRNLSEYLLKKTHKDVVRDFKDLSLRSLFSNQSNLAQSLSNTTKQQRVLESLHQEQELRVTVFRALGLKDRGTVVTDNDDDDEKIAGFKIRPLRPFIRVSYGKSTGQTTAAIGCHPTWNQTLKIKTKLTPLSSIQVNIFDEQRVPISDDGDQPLGTMHYRCQSKWLGCLQVPIKTVLDLGMLKGTFKVSSPPVLLGYESNPKTSHSLIPEVTQLMKKEAAFVSLQICTSLSHLGGGQGYNQPVPTDPDDYVIRHLNTFVTEYTNEFPPRNISLTYIDSAGQNKSVTHFLQPIQPPDYENFPKNPKSGSAMSKSSGLSSGSRKREEVDKSEGESVYSSFSGKGDSLSRLMDACVRYVALIPCYEVVESHVVTLLGVELLKVLHGSPLDHTILLASYFLYLGLKCYVATGFGLLRGLSHYVLVKYDLISHRFVLANDQFRSRRPFSRNDGCTWYVFDAVNGERFELRDVSCPLKSVGYVFDSENIWVNRQPSVDCESVSFDFTRSSEWQAVFDKTIFVMKLPIVSDTSLYSPCLSVDNLRQALEVKIKNKVQQWRPHVKTIWNRYCSTLLREVLPYWEHHAFNPTEQKPGLGQRLKQLMVTHKMFGFPLNIPYVNTKSVVGRVKATSIHVNGDPNAEFALGVEVYGYPNNVISVWVFLASITRI